MTEQTLRVIPLGGLGAIGKNMMVLEYGDALLVIDTGLMFPDDEMLGIDLVLPDFSYVVENRERVLGILLTHGHEDHVGALPYLLKEIDVPVYGTRLTLALVNAKLGEHGLQGKVSLNEVSPGKDLDLGPFRIEFLEVCHSIPDGVGLGIHTPVGTVVHTGDFKLDQTPIDCRPTAMQRFAELGRKGVLLLLSDSTNADSPGLHQPGAQRGAEPRQHLRPGARAASSWRRSPATSIASSRSWTRRRGTAARWPSSGAAWSRTSTSPRTWAI